MASNLRPKPKIPTASCAKNGDRLPQTTQGDWSAVLVIFK